MTHQIEFREDWGCVHLVHSGDLDVEEAYASRYAVRDLLVSNNCRKVLFDIRQAVYLLSEEEERLYLQSHRNLLPLAVRIALIVSDDLISDRDMVERLSMIPGVMQRLFSEENQALTWPLSP